MKKVTYILFIDILGYQKLAEEISSKTDFETSHLRRFYFRDPLDQALYKFHNSINYRQLTDNFLVFVYDLETVFEIIGEVSKLSIPFKNPIPIPLEIGLAKAELDEDFDPIDQDETIGILKMDLPKYYKEYYRKNNDKRITSTFIVITKDFYESLSEDRRLLCKKIDYTDEKGKEIIFYVAEQKMMQDVSGKGTNDIAKVKKFLDEIRIDSLWEYFELKALIFREAETGMWITQFIYVRLLDEPVSENSLRTNTLILIHRLYRITELPFVINSVLGREFHVNDLPPLPPWKTLTRVWSTIFAGTLITTEFAILLICSQLLVPLTSC